MSALGMSSCAATREIIVYLTNPGLCCRIEGLEPRFSHLRNLETVTGISWEGESLRKGDRKPAPCIRAKAGQVMSLLGADF